MKQVHISDTGRVVTVSGTDGAPMRFHAIWLRDNAPDPATRAAGNGQKLITIGDIPVDIIITQAAIVQDRLVVTFHPENKQVEYELTWLATHAYDRPEMRAPGWTDARVNLWQGGAELPAADFTEVRQNTRHLRDWLSGLSSHGVARLTGGPVQDQALFQVVALFGHVRETNYGRHFEVRTTVNPENLAYTGLGLQAHTDNPYRDPVPTVQVLYCLESSAAGGENMVVDGFAAARRLSQENPEGFRLLSRHCARFEYARDGDTILRSRRPMIELAPDGELIAIRFNNRSCATLTDVPFDDMEAYYQAYRHLAKIIDDPDMQVSFRLEPGECFVVDNTRVLHARRAYSGTGTRWLQGCYADLDGVRSRLAVLNRDLPDAAGSEAAE